jgi:uncharacterized protein YjbJ (UPF0337 family)
MAVLLKNFDPAAMFVWLRDTTHAGRECKRGDIVAKNEIGGVRKLMQLYTARKLGYPFQLKSDAGSLSQDEEASKMGLLDKLKGAAHDLVEDKKDELLDLAKKKAEEKVVDLVEKVTDKVKPKFTKK